MNMKLNPNSTQPPISDSQVWEHPWNKHMRKWNAEKHWENKLNKPNPPSKEAVKRAKFIDKTYHWRQVGDDSVRHGDKRTNK